MSSSSQTLLTDIGLSTDEAAVYNALLELGPSPARLIAKKTGIPRTLLYVHLHSLITQHLVEKEELPKKVAVFTTTHPHALMERAQQQKLKADATLAAAEHTVSHMVRAYNIHTNRPNVQVFEGIEGIKKVLDDSLTTKTEICSYVDIAAIEQFIPELNREYAKERTKRNIKKRNISADSEENRFLTEGYFPKITEERLVSLPHHSFKTAMFIYDNKVAYFTIGANPVISVIITDPAIAAMHRQLFELTWNNARQ